MNRFRKHIAFVLFLLFSFMQIAELHAFEHEDSTHEDCVLCNFSSEKNECTYLSTPILTVPEYVTVLVPVSVDFCSTEHYFQRTVTSLKNKAPPIS